MPLFYVNLFVIVVGAVCLWRAHRELSRTGRRSFATALLVWIVYLSHTAMAAWSSWNSVWPLSVDASVARGIGAVLLVTGFSVLAAGMIEFRSLARMSGRCPDRLVRTGVYGWTRNPQNVGWGLALLGIALCGRSAAALLLAVEFVLAFRLYIPWEERFLQEIYGEDWEAYSATTPRFLRLPEGFVQSPLTLRIKQREPEGSASDTVRMQ